MSQEWARLHLLAAGTDRSFTGLPMDLVYAPATVIFLLMAAAPMPEKPDRIKVKYGPVE